MTSILSTILGALLRTLEKFGIPTTLLFPWLDVLNWELFDETIREAFWDNGIELPGETPWQKAAMALTHATHVYVFLGSGFSVDAGIASFRDRHGDARAIYDDVDVSRMTNAETFQSDPEAQLAWHQRWRLVMESATPHVGQRALVEMLLGPSQATDQERPRHRRTPEVVFVTQNVDLLLEEAIAQRYPDQRPDGVEILHLHGRLDRARCHACGVMAYGEHEQLPDLTRLPPCAHCGGRLRPDVVWFGEDLPVKAWKRAREAAGRADVCLIIGTSALVHPAATLPMLAREHGARLIEINPRESLLTPFCDVHLEGNAKEALVRLQEAMSALSLQGTGRS